MKIGRLRIGVMPTNEDSRKTVAVWQHKSGYWRWCLSWYPNNRGFILIHPAYINDKWEPAYWTPGARDSVLRGIFSGHFSCWGTVPLIGGWSFSTQPPMRIRHD